MVVRYSMTFSRTSTKYTKLRSHHRSTVHTRAKAKEGGGSKGRKVMGTTRVAGRGTKLEGEGGRKGVSKGRALTG